MLPTDVPLSHLSTSLLLLLQLLHPASSFFPNVWSLLAAPGSVTHQDLTEEAALNVTLQLFLEQPPPGRPPLHLEDFLVSIPGSSHPSRIPQLPGTSPPEGHPLFHASPPLPPATIPKSPGPELPLSYRDQHLQFLARLPRVMVAEETWAVA